MLIGSFGENCNCTFSVSHRRWKFPSSRMIAPDSKFDEPGKAVPRETDAWRLEERSHEADLVQFVFASFTRTSKYGYLQWKWFIAWKGNPVAVLPDFRCQICRRLEIGPWSGWYSIIAPLRSAVEFWSLISSLKSLHISHALQPVQWIQRRDQGSKFHLTSRSGNAVPVGFRQNRNMFTGPFEDSFDEEPETN